MPKIVLRVAHFALGFSLGSAIFLYGFRGPAHGLYKIQLDSTSWTYNSSSIETAVNSLFFFQGGFDPSVQHNLNITNLGDFDLNIESLTVLQASP
jgi:hypothetical protein